MDNYAQKLENLVEILKKSPKINSYDTAQEKEADALAHSLLDMEQSFKIIINDLLPNLLSGKEANVDESLLNIGEELRHILYHIKDPKFFRYLIADSEA